MHSIRLASPWQRKRDGDQDWTRVKIPDSILCDATPVVYRRTFNRPSGLEADDKIWLRIPSVIGRIATIRINGHERRSDELGDSRRILVGEFLQAHNTLEIELVGEDTVGPIEPALIEIESGSGS